MTEYRSPGEKWTWPAVEEMGAKVEAGWKGLNLVALDGPYAGERVFLLHTEWVSWVSSQSRGLDVVVHPPGYLLDVKGFRGTPLGYYHFDRDSEGLR